MNIIEGFHSYYVYILTNRHRTVFYVGVTNNLALRLHQHKTSINNHRQNFTARYNVEFLIYFEKFSWIREAIAREKEIKGWRREKKLDLVKTENPQLNFLFLDSEIPPSSE